MWAALLATATLPIALFPAREVSATAWQPDTAVSYGVHRHAGEWDVMLHGNAFVQFIDEPPGTVHRTGGPAAKQASSVNWGMLMARRRAGAGRLGLDVMLSLEPWTVPGCGTLNYFQTGEMCGGDTIHDRQHPHDFLMALAAEYDRPLGSAWRWQIYGGVSGEPRAPAGGRRPSRMVSMAATCSCPALSTRSPTRARCSPKRRCRSTTATSSSGEPRWSASCGTTCTSTSTRPASCPS